MSVRPDKKPCTLQVVSVQSKLLCEERDLWEFVLRSMLRNELLLTKNGKSCEEVLIARRVGFA